MPVTSTLGSAATVGVTLGMTGDAVGAGAPAGVEGSAAAASAMPVAWTSGMVFSMPMARPSPT